MPELRGVGAVPGRRQPQYCNQLFFFYGRQGGFRRGGGKRTLNAMTLLAEPPPGGPSELYLLVGAEPGARREAVSAVGPDRRDSSHSGQLLFDIASASQSGLRHLSLPPHPSPGRGWEADSYLPQCGALGGAGGCGEGLGGPAGPSPPSPSPTPTPPPPLPPPLPLPSPHPSP